MHTVEVLRNALAHSVATERQLCLLIDSAHAENSHLKLDSWRIPFISLFDGTPEESLIEIAPLLIEINELDHNQIVQLFEWAQELAYDAPCVSWFETKVSASKIAAHLRLFHTVGLTEGQIMLMRWYDTRILPVWFACLTLQQVDAFAAGTFAWQYVDRTGSTTSLPMPQNEGLLSVEPIFGKPLITLTDQQFGLLVEAADLDVLLNHLRKIIPDELKRVPNNKLTHFVSRHQQSAISAGLHDIDRQTQYVLLALYTSGKGLEQQKFIEFMRSPPLDLNAFTEGLQALPDAVWEAGQPIWATSSMDSAQLEQDVETQNA